MLRDVMTLCRLLTDLATLPTSTGTGSLALVVAVLACGLICGPRALQAQNRLSAFDVHCFGNAKGSILVMAHFTNGTLRTFANACTPGTHATTPWPVIADTSGDVQSLTVAIHANAAKNLALHNECTVISGNGFLTGQCLVDEAGIDEVRVLISIPHVQ